MLLDDKKIFTVVTLKNLNNQLCATAATNTIRYDTVDLRALKSWRDGQLNLAHGPETKNNEKK